MNTTDEQKKIYKCKKQYKKRCPACVFDGIERVSVQCNLEYRHWKRGGADFYHIGTDRNGKEIKW